MVLGGGLRKFCVSDPDNDCERTDDRNLLEEWEANTNGSFVQTTNEMFEAEENLDKPILGLFTMSHMEEDLNRDPEQQPSLAEMTRTAIKFLSHNNPNGFVLLVSSTFSKASGRLQGKTFQVESGLIDRLHHKGRSHHAFQETLALSDSVEVALNMTDEKDTLIIVTADHSHTMSLSGYQARGTNILGKKTL